jgi:hypothetical protein
VNYDYNYLLVGGGLQNGLIALCLQGARPGVHVGIIEKGARLGGNHTWCFNESDVEVRLMKTLEPMVLRRWKGYRIRFPRLERTTSQNYCMIRFYGLPEETIQRFYALQMSTLDKTRLICGRPPRGFSLRRALQWSKNS